MSVFVEGAKPESLEKNPESKARTNNKLVYTHMALGWNRTQSGGRQVLSPLCHPCSSKLPLTNAK